MIGAMTNHTKPTLLISNVLPARPGDEAYNNICMRLWDRLLQAAQPTWNVIREYAQEDGAEGAALRAQHADAIIIMGGEDVHPSLYGASQGYQAEGRHWYRADRGQIALVDYAVRTGTPLLGICRGMQIINTALGGTLENDDVTQLEVLSQLTGVPAPAPLAALAGKTPRFDRVVDKADILSTVGLLKDL